MDEEKRYYVVEFIKRDLKGKRYMINIETENDKLYRIGPFEKVITKNPITFEEAEKLCEEGD